MWSDAGEDFALSAGADTIRPWQSDRDKGQFMEAVLESKLPTLSYSAPPAFFVGAYRYGRLHTLIGSIMLLAMAIAFGIVAYFVASAVNPYGRILVVGLPGRCLIAAGRTLYLWYTRKETPVKITEDGVEYGSRIWPWPQVARLGGKITLGGITLFACRNRLGPFPWNLMYTTPPLNEKQFVLKGKDIPRLRISECSRRD